MSDYPWLETLSRLEDSWGEVLPEKSTLIFADEMRFFNHLLLNDQRLREASSNPAAVRIVMMHQARTGLSLDPGIAHAYLGMRDGKMAFLPGYRGLTEIGMQERLILSCTPELVFETDRFDWVDAITKPNHVQKFPFGGPEECGKVVGGYCFTKRIDGEFIVTKMSIAELNDVRDYALSTNPDPESSAWFDTTGTRIWSMYKKTLQRRNTESWAFGSCPRMVAALSYATPDHLDLEIEKAEQGFDAPRNEPTVHVSAPSTLPEELGNYRARIELMAKNAERYSSWSTYRKSVTESYGKQFEVLQFALSLIPNESDPTTPGVAIQGGAS